MKILCSIIVFALALTLTTSNVFAQEKAADNKAKVAKTCCKDAAAKTDAKCCSKDKASACKSDKACCANKAKVEIKAGDKGSVSATVETKKPDRRKR